MLPAGSIAAAIVGSLTFIASFRASIVLLAFYYTSSKLTAYCEDRKSQDEDFKAGGQRDAKQVCFFCIHTRFPLVKLQEEFALILDQVIELQG